MNSATISDMYHAYSQGKSGSKRLSKSERKQSKIIKGLRRTGRGKLWQHTI